MITTKSYLWKINEVKRLLQEITFHEIDNDIIWIANVYEALGAIETAIDTLAKDIETDTILVRDLDYGTRRVAKASYAN